jgi:hypothetical protein
MSYYREGQKRVLGGTKKGTPIWDLPLPPTHYPFQIPVQHQARSLTERKLIKSKASKGHFCQQAATLLHEALFANTHKSTLNTNTSVDEKIKTKQR